ncbi:MAG: hypothetical protein ACFFAU_15630 [Candidatus Hodarchaeota archaeon]
MDHLDQKCKNNDCDGRENDKFGHCKKEECCVFGSFFSCASEGKKIDYLNENSLIWGQAIHDLGYREGECNHSFKTAQFKGKVNFM